MAFSWILASIVGGFIAWYWFLRRDDGRAPLPPGPKGLPLLGNLNDLPQPGVLEAHHWLKHKELYGPISSVTVMGQTIVIINDSRLAFEVMEKRSAIHSSRPKQLFAGEMVGWENSLGLSPYNNRFRAYRRNFARIIGSKPLAAEFNGLQQTEVGHFLLHVLDKPDDLVDHIRKEAGAIILKIAYGYTAESHKNDPLVDIVGDAMDKFAQAAVPGAFLVDIMPFLRDLPDWVPGTGFKKTAREWKAALMDVADRPYAFVKHRMAQGNNEKSFLSQLLEKGDSDGEEKFINKWAAMSLYAAGADTTVSAMACFFLAMSIFPDVQKKAQAEIERVIGTNRLPTAEDRENLPYIASTVKEVLRWHPVAPMGLPHGTTEDDLCEGYRIPKGAMIFANVWHFTHDPNVYHDPMIFKPERFLPIDGHVPEPDPATYVFGFGRRICPGRILADNTLYLSIAQSLAVFSIGKPVENGKEVEPVAKFDPGVVSHPAPYKCMIKPRSSHHEALIRSIEKDHPWQESDGKTLETLSV
ncbi:putative cytochrome P450 oxidoreductase OrdA-like protein [Eremomyces bilateralis CBS 781.70]|uniref:Cytochrome P450 oxidoreductase OrdA-like protein n=1 Tax=Eremomyces bilateralis CBS 781.70 TaxID=1392243 RepID=A0A6G1G1L4_9PEZI|nr:putative cytochrome P450 oxidoreductase OrdA-like protein [Eremomyces bilateralis CBS 781.70]KAF1811944.1 putative cytochrome P450 oxidoreductase OrdA-like protein [Eremomyces bilateralis CBS 781.70]